MYRYVLKNSHRPVDGQFVILLNMLVSTQGIIKNNTWKFMGHPLDVNFPHSYLVAGVELNCLFWCCKITFCTMTKSFKYLYVWFENHDNVLFK